MKTGTGTEPHPPGQPAVGLPYPDARPGPLVVPMTGVVINGHDLSSVPLASEITPGLWQGGSAGTVLPGFISHLISLSRRKPYKIEHHLTSHLTCPMSDSTGQDPWFADAIAAWANGCRDTGQAVMVQCAAGLNRSGLVVARALMLRDRMTADEAITLIRTRRSPACLHNSMFGHWLRSRSHAAPAGPGQAPDHTGQERPA